MILKKKITLDSYLRVTYEVIDIPDASKNSQNYFYM